MWAGFILCGVGMKKILITILLVSTPAYASRYAVEESGLFFYFVFFVFCIYTFAIPAIKRLIKGKDKIKDEYLSLSLKLNDDKELDVSDLFFNWKDDKKVINKLFEYVEYRNIPEMKYVCLSIIRDCLGDIYYRYNFDDDYLKDVSSELREQLVERLYNILTLEKCINSIRDDNVKDKVIEKLKCNNGL